MKEIDKLSLEVKKILRDMAMDEREVFLSVYGELEARTIEAAIEETAVRLASQRRAEYEAAKKKLPGVIEESTELLQRIAQWKTAHPDSITPSDLVAKKPILFQERERLDNIIRNYDHGS